MSHEDHLPTGRELRDEIAAGARQLGELHRRKDANGRVSAEDVRAAASAAAGTPSGAVPDAGEADGYPLLDRQIAAAEAKGDWDTLGVLNARKLAMARDRLDTT